MHNGAASDAFVWQGILRYPCGGYWWTAVSCVAITEWDTVIDALALLC